MLSAKDNEALTRVGRGTPMGELMRRYWSRSPPSRELDERPTQPVRLLGEDLVLYRDASGQLRPARSPLPASSRRPLLRHGGGRAGCAATITAGSSTATGRCLEQPFEDAAHPDGRFRDKIRITAYPVEAKAGLLWAYLGPAPAPLVPDWDLFGDQGYKQIVFSEVPCNWFQGQENSIDPVHFEWLHSNWTAAQRGEQRPGAARTSRSRSTSSSGASSTGGYARTRPSRTICGPSAACASGRTVCSPASSSGACPSTTSTRCSVAWFNDPVPGTAPFVQERIPYWFGPITIRSPGASSPAT